MTNRINARNWTDEKDAVIYEIFTAKADRAGIAEATDLMARLRTAFGLDFADVDVNAWIDRYEDENADQSGWQRHHDEVWSGANGRV
jgi:hypothetical protein